MHSSFKLARLIPPAFYLFVLGLSVALPLPAGATSKDDSFWAVYDSDVQHPWNRVFRALYDMTPNLKDEPDGWPVSVLRGPRHKKTIAVLDDFLNTHAERRLRDPVKQALLQNDVWKFFNWTLSNPGTTDDKKAQVTLQERLVRIMRRLALTEGEIEKLPDTYASAIRARVHPAAYDPANREQAFLPPDLWDEKGPWVLLGSDSADRTAAVVHTQKMGGSSDFFVFLSLPGGRDETLRMLRQLRAFDYIGADDEFAYLKRQEGLTVDFISGRLAIDEDKMRAWMENLLPPGTRVVLVREMRALSTSGHDYATRIVESLQIRVYRDSKLPPQYPLVKSDTRMQDTQPLLDQDAYVIRLDRRALATGVPGSLRPVELGEYVHNTNFINGEPWPAEIRPANAVSPLKAYATRIVDSCTQCHRPPGLGSFNTFLLPMMNQMVPKLHASEWKYEEGRGRLLQQYNLGYLRALWDSVRD